MSSRALAWPRRIAAVSTAVVMTACDPCSGIIGCTDSSTLAVLGRIVEDGTGTAARGVAIDFIRNGGTPLERDSVRVYTDHEGLFRLSVPAAAPGEVEGDLIVTPATGAPYRVRNQRFRIATRNGDARVLPTWSTMPRLPDLGMLFRRGFPPITIGDAAIEFRQTGGPPAIGLTNGLFETVTGSNGWFLLFGNQVRPTNNDDVIGDLVARLPPPAGDLITRDVHVAPTPVFRPAATVRAIGIGPNIEYHFATFDRGHFDRPVAGVRVEFQRTGGITVSQESWSAVTGAAGRVIFPGYADSFGTLLGRLRIIPPEPWKSYERDVVLEAYDVDGPRLFDTLGVGPGLPYYVRIRNGSAPLAGVGVEFRWVSGVPVVPPPSFTTKTNSSGIAYIEPDPEGEGFLTADISVTPPPPWAPFVVRGVPMEAIDGERSTRHVLLGDWDVAAPPSAVKARP